MSRRLESVAIVTGAGTGIGEAIAHKFAKAGASVVVNGLPDDPVMEVAAAIREYGAQAVGQQTPESLRQEPQGKLKLDHERQGLENKQTETVK